MKIRTPERDFNITARNERGHMVQMLKEILWEDVVRLRSRDLRRREADIQ
jgi:hypothetical protein